MYEDDFHGWVYPELAYREFSQGKNNSVAVLWPNRVTGSFSLQRADCTAKLFQDYNHENFGGLWAGGKDALWLMSWSYYFITGRLPSSNCDTFPTLFAFSVFTWFWCFLHICITAILLLGSSY